MWIQITIAAGDPGCVVEVSPSSVLKKHPVLILTDILLAAVSEYPHVEYRDEEIKRP